MKLRQILGRQLISLGRMVYGPLPLATKLEEDKPPIKDPRQKTKSMVVEATDKPVHWQPHQTGNIVVAEPLLMSQYRRQGGDPNEV